MRIRTCIKQVARARGLTVADVARRLGLFRSNLSAADAGRRALSLQALGRLADALACSPGELLEGVGAEERPLFRRAHLNRRLAELDRGLADGTDRTWVHAVWLAWQRHYHNPP